MEELVKKIQEQFGSDTLTNAVFFHHDKEGKLTTLSPLTGNVDSIPKMVAQLYEYSAALKTMADDMVQRSLNKN